MLKIHSFFPLWLIVTYKERTKKKKNLFCQWLAIEFALFTKLLIRIDFDLLVSKIGVTSIIWQNE